MLICGDETLELNDQQAGEMDAAGRAWEEMEARAYAWMATGWR